MKNFNPRPPRGERPNSFGNMSRYVISIHAPREGSDRITKRVYAVQTYFNPRPPRGERLNALEDINSLRISIHAPREGSDPNSP